MFSAKTYAARRNMLRTKIGSGIILLPGNSLSPNNYPNNAYYFRQDSSFRYYFGLNTPSLAGLIDADTGEEALYGDDFTVEDIIWTGPQPTLRELGAEVGVTATFPMAELEKRLRKAVSLGRKIHYLPPYRGETKLQLSALLGIKPELLHDYKSVELMFAVAEMREKKSAEEVEAMERAFLIGYQMHTLAMHMCHPGVIEREIAGAIEGIAKSSGSGLSFPSIVSQHGETLHNLNADGVLEQGRLLLCDAGCETVDGYCSDHTRTYPVSGRFTQKQKEIYNVVLAAHDHVARIVKPHMMYTEIHNAAYMTLAEGLVALGLLKGTAADAVASGAMTMLMPHGLGHGLGMDVHDCEAMGERSFDFSTIADRAAKSGTCIYRAAWRIEPGTVMTDEPGLYFIPALIDKCRAEGLYKGIVDYDALEAYRDFGGIRIEDDILVTEEGSRMLGDRKIPITVEELEAAVGREREADFHFPHHRGGQGVHPHPAPRSGLRGRSRRGGDRGRDDPGRESPQAPAGRARRHRGGVRPEPAARRGGRSGLRADRRDSGTLRPRIRNFGTRSGTAPRGGRYGKPFGRRPAGDGAEAGTGAGVPGNRVRDSGAGNEVRRRSFGPGRTDAATYRREGGQPGTALGHAVRDRRHGRHGRTRLAARNRRHGRAKRAT